MIDDDDLELDEASAGAAERAEAAAFGRLVDALADGAALPPAMDADQRALARSATQIIAGTRIVELDEGRSRRLIDAALEAALTGRRPTPLPLAGAAPAVTRTGRAQVALPWIVATVAAAAAIVLFVTRPPTPTARRAALPIELTSRPSDVLVGRIPHAEVAEASRRLDDIYADRLAGYRALTLGGEP